VHVSGSKLDSPIVYHETCRDCEYVQIIEDSQYRVGFFSLLLPTFFVVFIVAYYLQKTQVDIQLIKHKSKI